MKKIVFFLLVLVCGGISAQDYEQTEIFEEPAYSEDEITYYEDGVVELESGTQEYSRADEKVSGIFSGRYKLGLGDGILGVYSPSVFAFIFSTGFDFNFKVFEESYGSGAGNLFVGIGIDFEYLDSLSGHIVSHLNDYHYDYDYYDYSKSSKNHLITIPIKLNMGYEFKIGRGIRYFGLWFSPGLSLDMDVFRGTRIEENEEKENFTYFTVSFAWEFTMNMIFRQGIFMYWGNSGSKSSNKILNVRTKEDYVWGLDRILCFKIGVGVIF